MHLIDNFECAVDYINHGLQASGAFGHFCSQLCSEDIDLRGMSIKACLAKNNYLQLLYFSGKREIAEFNALAFEMDEGVGLTLAECTPTKGWGQKGLSLDVLRHIIGISDEIGINLITTGELDEEVVGFFRWLNFSFIKINSDETVSLANEVVRKVKNRGLFEDEFFPTGCVMEEVPALIAVVDLKNPSRRDPVLRALHLAP